MKYIGFDLGDGESCISVYDTEKMQAMPVECSITGFTTFPTIVGSSADGTHHIGTLVHSDMQDVRACFKRDFRSQTQDVKNSYHRFIEGVIAQIRTNHANILQGDYQFVVGQPADWDNQMLSQFVEILENSGIPTPLLTSESRAALVYFKNANVLGVSPCLLKGTVLIIDFGSSTLDFAYIDDGDVDKAKVFGDPHLGGGLMDEQIVIESINLLTDNQRKQVLFDILKNDPTRRSQLMLEARCLKEMYFTNQREGNLETTRKSCPIFCNGIQTVTLQLNDNILSKVIMCPQLLLENNSLYSQLQDQLNKARLITASNPAKLVILTGGASQMGFFNEMCRDALGGSDVVICSSLTPSYDIARGLALAGKSEAAMKAFKAEIQKYGKSNTVENIVQSKLPELVTELADLMIDLIIPNVVIPEVKRWKQTADAVSLDTLNQSISQNVHAYLETAPCKEAMAVVIRKWSNLVFALIQRDIDEMCQQYHISTSLLQLKNTVVAVKEANTGEIVQISNLVDVIVSATLAVMLSVLCGGAGTALIAAGPIGIIVGMIAGIVVGLVGARFAREQAMTFPISRLIRQVISESSIKNPNRIQAMKTTFASSLLNDHSLKQSLVHDISKAIDDALDQIATQERLG